jgi:hypothetical protein
MRWNVPNKLTPKETKLVARMRRKSRFYLFLREIRGQLFDEEFQAELAKAYAPRGQAPVPPALLAMVCLLQAYTGVSDAEAVDEAEMDMRWQLVLGTLGQDKAPFGQGSLPRFRERLIEHDLDQRLLDRTVALAKKTGGFGWQKLKAALDSSPLSGAGRVEDSWNLIGHAMSRMVVVMAKAADVPRKQIIGDAGLTLLAGSSIKAALDINWDDREQRSEALNTVVAQAHALLAWAREHLSTLMERPDVREATELLERILGQDTEPDPDRPNRVRIKRGVAKDRICSVGDPDLRHGRKSRSKAFNGYKRYVATHVDVPLILAAEALPANVPEYETVPTLLASVRAHGALDELAIDRGFLSHPDIEKLERDGTKVTCRPWPIQNNTGRFTKLDFSIDLRSRRVTCPGGETATYSKKKLEAQFDAEECAACKLRDECTTSSSGRSIQIHPQEALQRRLRKQSSTTQGRRSLRERVAVEHRLARVGRSQTKRARYKGTRKNTLDLRRHAALANLLELGSALAA